MKAAYPIIMSRGKSHIVVFIPDFSINTQGTSYADAMEMARDAIGLWGICRQDMGQAIPPASNLSPVCSKDEIMTLVDIDFDAYRRAQDSRSVRRNVTLPCYLNELGEKAGINFSQVLQEGLKQRLGVS